MTDTTRIPIEDLHRRPNARKTDAALVEAIAASMRVLGFRDEKPVVVRKDGNLYWIIDGDHRVEAAKLAGITEAPVVIEDLDDAGVLTYEGALNVQRPDTPEEKWARAQGFFALGVDIDPEAVTVATGLTPETQEAARKARVIVGDDTAFEETTTDDLPVILALENDREALAEYLKKPRKERVWRGSQILNDIKNAALKADFLAACKVAKVKVITDQRLYPEGYTFIGRTPADIAKMPEGAVAVRVEDYGTPYVSWYAEAGEQTEAQKAEAEAKEKRATEQAALDMAQDDRRAFITDERRITALKAFCEKAWESGYTADVGYLAGTEVKGWITRMAASVLVDVDADVRRVFGYHDGLDDYSVKHHGKDVVAYYDAIIEAGYEPNEVEAERLALLRAAVKKAKKKEADNG